MSWVTNVHNGVLLNIVRGIEPTLCVVGAHGYPLAIINYYYYQTF